MGESFSSTSKKPADRSAINTHKKYLCKTFKDILSKVDKISANWVRDKISIDPIKVLEHRGAILHKGPESLYIMEILRYYPNSETSQEIRLSCFQKHLIIESKEQLTLLEEGIPDISGKTNKGEYRQLKTINAWDNKGNYWVISPNRGGTEFKFRCSFDHKTAMPGKIIFHGSYYPPEHLYHYEMDAGIIAKVPRVNIRRQSDAKEDFLNNIHAAVKKEHGFSGNMHEEHYLAVLRCLKAFMRYVH